jgi:ABC-type dipeptide/oligopeptide/nickel transport system ATPase subunit
MKKYIVDLKSDASNSFMSVKAAQSMDIKLNEKLRHHLEIEADLDSDFQIGLILGNSGSGKTTLAKKIYGENSFDFQVDYNRPIIDQFPEKMSYDERSNILNSIGLSQVVCWIRPVSTLSNGQKFRAEAALKIAKADNEVVCIDEWTSVVDRTVAKVMSHSLQKAARKFNKKFVLCSCHYDVVEWLQPNWIIDCNKQSFENRGLLRQNRNEKLNFEIRSVQKSSWSMFSRYHYLSDKLPGGKIYTFGLFYENQQIGFQCFANYVPTRKNDIPIYHFNRTVIHPDYVGLGLGLKMINETSKYMKNKYNYKIMGKFSSVPVFKALKKDVKWKLVDYGYQTPEMAINGKKRASLRQKVKWYSFAYCE